MFMVAKIKYLPLSDHNAMPELFVFICYTILLLVFNFVGLRYNTIFFLINLSFATVWLNFWVWLKRRLCPVKMGYFKSEASKDLKDTHRFSFIELNEENLETIKEMQLQGILYDETSLNDELKRYGISELGINNVPVIKISTILERSTGIISFKYIKELSFEDFYISTTYPMIKRGLDIIITIIASPILLILAIFTAIGVKLDSPGPAIFTQVRTGKGDKPFKMYKFRSMRVETEDKNAQFAKENDSRVTEFGKFIRKYRLDEIPQFFNILKGDMSLIGPRPEQKVFTDQFNKQIPFYPYRHAVKPGISGWAQVNQGYAATVEQTEQKVEYDLFYIKNFTMWLDLLIAVKTIKTIFTGFGAR